MAVCFGGTWPAGKLAVEDVTPVHGRGDAVHAGDTSACRLGVPPWWLRSAGPSRLAARARARRPRSPVTTRSSCTVSNWRLPRRRDHRPGVAPVFSTPIAWPVLGERIGGRRHGGSPARVRRRRRCDPASGGVDRDRALGALLFVAGAAVGHLLGAREERDGVFRRRHSHALRDGETRALMLIPFSIGESGWSKLASGDAAALVSILYLAVFGTVLAFVLFYEGVSRIGASRATAFALLVPIFGVLGSVLQARAPSRGRRRSGRASRRRWPARRRSGSRPRTRGRTRARSRRPRGTGSRPREPSASASFDQPDSARLNGSSSSAPVAVA